jgi:hypothetical protein
VTASACAAAATTSIPAAALSAASEAISEQPPGTPAAHLARAAIEAVAPIIRQYGQKEARRTVRGKNKARTAWGPGAIGPVHLVPPAEECIRDVIIATADAHPQWGPLRIFEELLDRGANLTEANVHWVLCQYKLRDYT